MKNLSEKTVLELSNVKAKEYFLEPENYCNVQFPDYIDFKPILDFVKEKVKNKELEEILRDKEKKPSLYEDINHKILVKKDALYSYRPIQIINPYLYYSLVNVITNKKHWDEIKKRFNQLSVQNIEVVSIPKVKAKKDKSHLSATVSSWWENVEQRSLELALSYRYMFVTDISNCYDSIYTHTIAWALMGKDEAKEKREKAGPLGNKIDRYMQGMQYGQTNGIPQGSVMSDFIAELVLAYADKMLDEKLKEEEICDYRIIRYRDDYRIFCNSKESIERIAFFLHEVLADLNFRLNEKKTFLTEDVITESIKSDKRTYISEGTIYRKTQKGMYSTMSNIQQEAFYIHQFSKRYPNSGTLIKLLTFFQQELENKKKLANSKEALVLISIFTDIAISSPKTYKQILAIISNFISVLTQVEKEKIVDDIYAKFQRFPNIGELQIWIQRITYKIKSMAYTEDICKIVNNENGVKLWNNEWVADEYIDGFPQSAICNTNKRDNINPIININEVSLFNNY